MHQVCNLNGYANFRKSCLHLCLKTREKYQCCCPCNCNQYLCNFFCKSEIGTASAKNWLWKHHGKYLGRTMKLKARKNSTVHCCVKKFYKKSWLDFLIKNSFVIDKYRHDLFVFICDKKSFLSRNPCNLYQFKYCKNRVHSRYKPINHKEILRWWKVKEIIN